MKIGAYYYGWYEQNWLHKTIRSSDPPRLGEYNNTIASDAVNKHMEMLSLAGVDFISISFQGEDHGHLIDAAAKHDIKVTYFYESLHRSVKGLVPFSNLASIIEDIEAISEFMLEPNWLRIDGRPVLMIYVTRCFRDKPAEMFKAIRDAFPDIYLVADELFWNDVPDERMTMFDAITAYNMYQPGRFSTESDEKTFDTYLNTAKTRMISHKAQADRLSLPLWGTAMPGYDDTGVRPDVKHAPIPRLDGKFFEASLEDALNISSGAMMICSWNEVYEDSQIEPMTSYGTKYMDILRAFKEKKCQQS
jgi:Glycosyl hydrolase family 99